METNSPNGKPCSTGCGCFKSLEHFAVNSRNRDGRENKCKECMATYRQKRNERMNEKQNAAKSSAYIVPARTPSPFRPYKQEREGYVRNDGNEGIKSFGF